MRFFCMPFMACNRQVDSIDRRQCNLQAVPHDVDRYARSLEELLLDMNHIQELKPGLFRLPKLRRLGLSDNDIHRLPPEIAHLQSLVELNISRNDISDLPDEIKQCKQLLILDISSNPIARLPDSLTMILSLTSLALNDNSLTRLPQDIGRLTGLRSLEVRENHLRNLPSSITNLVHLRRLDLGQNELDELPVEIGALRNLIEFYLDENSVELLPESFLNCRGLEQFDIASNRLTALPEDFGELERLTDLTLSHNCLTVLPSSIGRLRRVNIIKADDNSLTELTPAIGSCASLTELYLMQNMLSDLPSTVGNLRNLSHLNLDKNHLITLPSLIGNCSSMNVLSVRDNRIEELPMEIGKLSHLRVLDVCNNRLNSLPYTISVLYELQALWLSENQSQAMLKLTEETNSRGIRILTCYLLPQQSANANEQPKAGERSGFIGGPKVHFGEHEIDEAEEALRKLAGRFERHDTPHPKPGGTKLKKQLVDGHVIQHEDDRRPSMVSLTKKPSASDFSTILPRNSGPKSSLKHPPVHNVPSSSGDKERNVAFALPSYDSSPDNDANCRLKRVNTPHYGRQARMAALQNQSGAARQKLPTQSNNSSQSFETKRIIIRREPGLGFGLSIAGGLESTPYVENDAGLFISKLTAGAPAEKSGVRIGDKLLEINGTSMVDQRHDAAVKCIQQNSSAVELVIRREVTKTEIPRPVSSTSVGVLPNEPVHTISATIQRDPGSPLGMSMLHTETVDPLKSPLRVEFIAPKGPADRNGNIKIGDEVISINEKDIRGMPFPTALSILQDGGTSELRLVLKRSPSKLEVGELPYGDTTKDGTMEEVHLVRDSKNSLGLSVVGGVDHSSHPFGVEEPGVFISKISPNSPASRSKKLRVGDRILKVNGHDVNEAKHTEAVEILKNSGQKLLIVVRHEPQPKNLREVFFKRRSGEAIGLTINGGIGTPANPNDKLDEGIFIERIEEGSCVSETSKLQRGNRILEVNDDSLLGCSKTEAAQILRKTVGVVRLLVCDGLTAVSNGITEGRAAECSFGSSSVTLPSFSNSSTNLNDINGNLSTNNTAVCTPTPLPSTSNLADGPLARSSPIPIKPADKEKPNIRSPTNSITTFSTTKSAQNNEPEKMAFNSKLKHFETESRIHPIYPQRPTTTTAISSELGTKGSLKEKKGPLVTENAIQRAMENLQPVNVSTFRSFDGHSEPINIPIRIHPDDKKHFDDRIRILKNNSQNVGSGSISAMDADQIKFADADERPSLHQRSES